MIKEIKENIIFSWYFWMMQDYFFTAFTLFIGVTFPFFGDLLGFFGGFGFAPTSYFVSHSAHHFTIWFVIYFHNFSRVNFIKSNYGWKNVQLPSIIWLKIMKPKRFSRSWFINWVKINTISYIFFFFFFSSEWRLIRKLHPYKWWIRVNFSGMYSCRNVHHGGIDCWRATKYYCWFLDLWFLLINCDAVLLVKLRIIGLLMMVRRKGCVYLCNCELFGYWEILMKSFELRKIISGTSKLGEQLIECHNHIKIDKHYIYIFNMNLDKINHFRV